VKDPFPGVKPAAPVFEAGGIGLSES
jgi:hypothetical protein